MELSPVYEVTPSVCVTLDTVSVDDVTEHRLCPGLVSEPSTHATSLTLTRALEVVAVIIPILQLGGLRHREVRELPKVTPGHMGHMMELAEPAPEPWLCYPVTAWKHAHTRAHTCT